MLDESAWMTVRINGRPVRLLRSRKVPPGFLVQYDDGRAVAASGLSVDEIARRMTLADRRLHWTANGRTVYETDAQLAQRAALFPASL